MTVLQSWKDSLQLLKPKNFKLFALVTIKSIMQAYKIYLQHFGWMILLLSVCAIAPYFMPSQNYAFYNIQYKHIFFYTSCWLYELLFLAAIFCTRPSILQKDSTYFIAQFKKIILFWIFVPIFSWSSATYYGYIFTVLFFADSEGGPKRFLLSLWNALKMVFYNFFLMWILGAVVYLCGLIGASCLAKFLILQNISLYPYFFLLFNLIGALLLPIGVCIYTNLYIKRLHDQFDLYFKQPE